MSDRTPLGKAKGVEGAGADERWKTIGAVRLPPGMTPEEQEAAAIHVEGRVREVCANALDDDVVNGVRK